MWGILAGAVLVNTTSSGSRVGVTCVDRTPIRPSRAYTYHVLAAHPSLDMKAARKK